jgi:F0F1-type ATP synthase epsilon subunit
MLIKVKEMKEMEDGSAIVWMEMDNDAKEFFIGEGFLAVLKRSVDTSESFVTEEMKDVKPTSKTKANRSKQQGEKKRDAKGNSQKN